MPAPSAAALVLIAVAAAEPATAPKPPGGARAAERAAMVEAILAHRDVPVTDERTIEALRSVPRHLFVPERLQDEAYLDRPLPIGHGQTISQPYIVALMTQLLEVRPDSRVLEVGTGSGYQAAVLAQLTPHVASVEIIPELAAAAARTLERAGATGVATRQGDGYFGWQERAPFDRIIVTAAAGHVPPPLLRQLAPGGRMVIPVGSHWQTQELLLVTKEEDGSVRTRSVLPVRFVPLTGQGRH